MKTLNDFDFNGKIVLLRCDLNSDVQNKKLLKSERIKEAAITINELKKKKAKIVILAHQGRPGDSDFISLKQHSKQLNKYTKVKFVEDIIGKKAEKAIKELKIGEALLLENVRNLKEEFNAEENKITSFFSKMCEIYVNDAFSVCHRAQASILLPKYIKKSCAGRILEREVNALSKIKLKNTLYILGGAKPEDNIKLLGNHKVLSCGLFGQVCLINKGKKLGEQENYLNKKKIFIKIPKIKLKNVKTPLDFAVNINGRKEISLEGFPNKNEIFDIGSITQKNYIEEIKKAKAIYMKGPAGDCSKKEFSKGTFSILNAIANSKAFSVIGGGHLSDAIVASKINKKKFSHISLSGGALLNYIAGEKLPGLKVLGIK
ncbi:MAG TPA: phosphoglycerate kinase [Candidatus Pacearchaeota archaeon]|nr:phosphoglycerate kinase [Candidatus Pacearchaeota archaeon]